MSTDSDVFMQNEPNFRSSRLGHRSAGHAGSWHVEKVGPLRIGQLKMPSSRTGRRDGLLQEDAAQVRKRIGPRVSRVEEFD